MITQVLLVLQRAHLGSGQLSRFLVLCLVHLPERTVAQLADHVPEVVRVRVHADVVEDALLLRLPTAQVKHLLQVV